MAEEKSRFDKMVAGGSSAFNRLTKSYASNFGKKDQGQKSVQAQTPGTSIGTYKNPPGR
jgi:hypothetical protein